MTPGRSAGGATRGVALARAAGIYLRAAPAAAAVRVAAAVATSLGPVAMVWLTKAALDQLSRPAGRALLPAAAGLAAATGLLAVVQHVVRYTDQEMGRRVTAYTQDRLFVAVGRLRGLAELENPATHDRLRLAQQASTMAPQQLTNALLGIVQSSLSAAGFLVSLATLSPLLVGLVVASALPALYAQLSLGRQRAGTMLTASPRLRRQMFYSNLLLDLRAAKEIRIFGLWRYLRDRMLGELRAAQALERRMDRRTLWLDVLLSLLTAVVSGVALITGVSQIARHGSVGDLSVLVAALAGVQAGLAGIIAQAASMSQMQILFDHYLYVTTRLGTGARRQRSLFRRQPPTTPTTPSRPAPAELHHGVELRDVWFRYDATHDWILRGVNLFIPAGRSLALVGANGAGKSTIVKLLCLLYEPHHGGILWDGVDVRGLDPEQVRRRIGVVFQDYMNYDMSARDNIGIGNLEVIGEESRLRTAAEFAGMHDTLARLPMGYDTTLSRAFLPEAAPQQAAPSAVVGPSGLLPRAAQPGGSKPRRHHPAAAAPESPPGVLLSGGQWQRIALARAVLRDDADLLILDEPSAGLDVEAEAAIHSRLQRLRAGRTSLLISHRMNTIRSADLIAVLHGGRVIEQGSHQQLMATDSRYAALFRTQASGYQLVQ